MVEFSIKSMERGRCQLLDQEGPMCSSPDRRLLWHIWQVLYTGEWQAS